jgi:transcriptional regulator with XRE-family HTH domain
VITNMEGEFVQELSDTKFPQNLRKLRNLFGLSQSQLARGLGITSKTGAQTISSWERGLREPSYGTLVNIANFFRVSTDELLGRTKERSKFENKVLLLLEQAKKLPPSEQKRILKILEILVAR